MFFEKMYRKVICTIVPSHKQSECAFFPGEGTRVKSMTDQAPWGEAVDPFDFGLPGWSALFSLSRSSAGCPGFPGFYPDQDRSD